MRDELKYNNDSLAGEGYNDEEDERLGAWDADVSQALVCFFSLFLYYTYDSLLVNYVNNSSENTIPP